MPKWNITSKLHFMSYSGLFNSSVPALLPFLGSCHCFQTTNPLSSPIFHGCVNERLADRTPSPTFSTTDSEITEMADERQSEMSDLIDDEAFVDDTSSDAGTEEGSDIFSDGQDPFYDRSPWFILVGRLVTGSGNPPRPPHTKWNRSLGGCWIGSV